MSNAIVNVVHPTERVDDSAAALTEIASWRVEYKANAATEWGPLGGARPVEDTSANVGNLTTGKYNFRAYWTDTDGQESDPASCDYDVGVPAKLKPGAISVVGA